MWLVLILCCIQECLVLILPFCVWHTSKLNDVLYGVVADGIVLCVLSINAFGAFVGNSFFLPLSHYQLLPQNSGACLHHSLLPTFSLPLTHMTLICIHLFSSLSISYFLFLSSGLILPIISYEHKIKHGHT